MNRPDPLSPELAALLAVERDIEPAPSALRERVVLRARASVRQAPKAITPSFWGRRASLLAAAALVTAFAMVAIAGFRGLRGSEPAVELPHPAADSPTKPRPPEPSVAPPLALEPQPAPEVAPPQPSSAMTTPRRPSAGNAYAVELSILQRARAAVAGGRFSSALDAIAEHQRRFPAGNLREEREALRVRALAGLGRSDEARRAAESFRDHYPGSVLSPRIEETARPAP